MWLDENDDEHWNSSDSDSVTTWDDAVKLLGKDWFLFYPSRIHPEFADRLQALVEQHAADFDRYRTGQDARRRWKQAIAASRSRK